MKQQRIIIWLIITVIMSLFSCNSAEKKQAKKNYYKYTGSIQGTSFSIIYEHSDDLAVPIDSLLKTFNKSLDNYDANSLISRINNNENPELDTLFVSMFRAASEVWVKTGGLFDISIAPLANAWGFGYENGELPDSVQVDSLLQFVGLEKISIVNNHLQKTDSRIKIIGNALAQGLSVDYVADNLRAMGVENYLIEIGGEIKSKGVNQNGEIWRVGIDKPLQGTTANNRELISSVELSNKSIATSGNYRKFHIVDGKAFGHAISPKTGYPYSTDILSVTVITDKCIYADAWATSFMLMQSDQAIELANDLKDIEIMIITAKQTETDKLEYNIQTSSGFPKIGEI